LNFKFHVFIRFGLIHVDQHKVSFKLFNGHQQHNVIWHIYYTLYGPNHFLINFPRCDLLPFGNHKT
jgi:hypothetical protein